MPDLALSDADRQRHDRPVRWSAIVGGGVLTALIFVVDLLLPLGIAGGIPYIAPVLLAMWLPDRRLIMAVAALCTVLVLAGLLLSPPGAGLTIALPNRGLAIAAIWTVGILTFQRRSVEGALARSEAAKRAVLATTADGIAMLDADGRVLSANPAFVRMFGRAEDHMLGTGFDSLLSEDDAHRFLSRRQRFLQAGEDGSTSLHEMDGVRPGGERFPIEVVFVPVDQEGTTRFTVTVRDITERRLLEKHLLRVSDQERRAIGYSLHEELGQAITGLSLISRRLAEQLEHRESGQARNAAELAELLQEVDRQALGLFRTISPLEAVEHFHEAFADMVHRSAERHDTRASLQGPVLDAPRDPFRAAQLFEVLRAAFDRLLDLAPPTAVVVRTDGSSVQYHVTYDEGTEVDCGDALRPMAYRAKLIEAHLECARAEASVTVSCGWSGETAALGDPLGASAAA